MKNALNPEFNNNVGGRPKIVESQYQDWLDYMKPFLLLGHSLNHAILKAGLNAHRTSMYKKYAQKDWFSDKINRLQATLGELTNEIFFGERALVDYLGNFFTSEINEQIIYNAV